jgi:uncharacterized phage protein (predicted DNA packaging)
MYLTLQQVKKHLYIDHNDDDQYLADLITVAEDAVKTDLNISSLSDIEDNAGMLPASVIQAMLLLIGTLYANRESVTYGTPNAVPHAYQYLLDLNRTYYTE